MRGAEESQERSSQVMYVVSQSQQENRRSIWAYVYLRVNLGSSVLFEANNRDERNSSGVKPASLS